MNLILILSNSLGAGKWTSFLISRGNNNVNNQRPNGPPESTYIHIRAGGLSAFQNWTPANLAGSQFSLIIFPFLWNIYMEPSWNPPKYPISCNLLLQRGIRHLSVRPSWRCSSQRWYSTGIAWNTPKFHEANNLQCQCQSHSYPSQTSNPRWIYRLMT